MKTWVCVVCGYVHSGDEPPDECPVCGAPRSEFQLSGETAPTAPAQPVSGAALRIVILGAGIAGVTAAENARAAAPNSEVTLLSREPGLPYYRVNLTRLLAGEVNESDLLLHPHTWYADQRIDFREGVEASAIDVSARRLELRGAAPLSFDRLVFAAGAQPFVPPIPGSNRKGVFSLRTLANARELLGCVKPGARVVCVGGGILGLESAGALAKRGAAVTLLEAALHLMPRQLNRRAGEILASFVGTLGVRLVPAAKTREFAGDDRVRRVVLEDGSVHEADLVVVAAGVRSDAALARAAGLKVNQGVLVDDRLASSTPDIFAAGDAAEHNGVLYGSWHAAQVQGEVAGRNAAGGSATFAGIARSHTLKILGLGMSSVGVFDPPDATYRVVEDEPDGNYRRFVLRDDRLAGAILLGDTRLATAAGRAIEGRGPVPAIHSAADLAKWLEG